MKKRASARYVLLASITCASVGLFNSCISLSELKEIIKAPPSTSDKPVKVDDKPITETKFNCPDGSIRLTPCTTGTTTPSSVTISTSTPVPSTVSTCNWIDGSDPNGGDDSGRGITDFQPHYDHVAKYNSSNNVPDLVESRLINLRNCLSKDKYAKLYANLSFLIAKTGLGIN